MAKQKIGLLPKILIAIALGIGASFVAPEWLVRVFVTVNGVFSNLLGLIIPFLIIGLVAPGICELGKGSGRLLLITVALAYVSTLFSGFSTYFACSWVYPSLLEGQAGELANVDTSGGILPYFTLEMPAPISVTSALVLAFLLGIGVSWIKGGSLRALLIDWKDWISAVIAKVIIPFLPVYIFGIFLKIGAEGMVGGVMGVFIKIVLVILVLHVLLLLVQFCVAGIVAKKNPLRALANMLPAYVTALGTQSSAATIPITLESTLKNGVRKELAEFSIPLCATIHLAGSILKIVSCALAISMIMGMPVGLDVYAGFILMLAVTMVAAPGVPGGAIMAAIGIIGSILGFDADMQGIMIAVYIALDGFGTACNVTGDGAIALILNSIGSRKQS